MADYGNVQEDKRTMKKLLSVLLLTSTCVLAPFALVPHALAQSNSVPAMAPAQNAAPMHNVASDPTSQKARQLLDQMIAALGGQAWLTYKTSEQRGRSYSFYHGRPNSAGTLYWRFYEYPDKERQELTKQRDVVYIYNGDKGYEKTYKGTASEEDKIVQEIVRRRQHSLEVVLREWLKDPQTVLFYEGQSVADQQMVDVVSILNKNNDQLSIGIDIHTRLPINKRYTWRDPDKYKVEEETIYGNYRTVQGITTPYTITNKRDGEISGQTFLTHVEYNATFQTNFFDAKATYNPEVYNPKDKKK
jgi:hypothetical protein